MAVIAPLPLLDVVLEASPPAGDSVSGGGTFLKTSPFNLTADFGPHPPPSAFFRRGADDTVPDDEPDGP